MGYDNPISIAYNAFSCSSGKNNLTLGPHGEIFTCNRLAKNSALTKEE